MKIHYFILALLSFCLSAHSAECNLQSSQINDTDYLLKVYSAHQKLNSFSLKPHEREIYQKEFDKLAAQTKDNYPESNPYFHNGRILDCQEVSKQMKIAKKWRDQKLIEAATAAYKAHQKKILIAQYSTIVVIDN